MLTHARITLLVVIVATLAGHARVLAESPLSTEPVAGDGVWVAPAISAQANRMRRLRIVVWFDQQFLGDGAAYARRAKEFADAKRTQLRRDVVQTLRDANDRSYEAAKAELSELLENKVISALKRHWIVNGFSCTTTLEGVEKLKSTTGVKKIFLSRGVSFGAARAGKSQPAVKLTERKPFNAKQFKHPWYVRALQADRVWKEWGVAGEGTLNVVHDGNFVFSPNIAYNAYRNSKETPDNGIDDDKNGYVDDVHGFNFQRGDNRLTTRSAPANRLAPQLMHGSMCAAIICGAGTEASPYEFGVAPEARWAGVIAGGNLEQAVEWAILQGADTYSMSFSIPGLGETRSHWRKAMEHGSFCGVYFVSGAGNFAQSQPVPVQMRVPEDIPNVVFAAAGVQRDFSRTPFSSKGPVEWKTEHYQDGRVQKPEVCAFNMGLPLQMPGGGIQESAINGNSFAGPMFCGSIALMLSADPDLLPWDLREIITSTATDVAKPGVDDETGHGLINCYRAVKEVLRRKAAREGKDTAPFTGRSGGDELNIKERSKQLKSRRLVVSLVQPGSPAAAAGIKKGDKVISVNDQPIADAAAFRAARTKSQGDTTKLKVSRGAKIIEVELKPGRFGVALTMTFAEPVFE